MQSISWTLKEAVQFGPDGLAGEDWTTYPVITFTESPAVDVVLLDRPGEPPWARVRPRSAPPPQPWLTPSGMQSASACANCPLRPSVGQALPPECSVNIFCAVVILEPKAKNPCVMDEQILPPPVVVE